MIRLTCHDPYGRESQKICSQTMKLIFLPMIIITCNSAEKSYWISLISMYLKAVINLISGYYHYIGQRFGNTALGHYLRVPNLYNTLLNALI